LVDGEAVLAGEDQRAAALDRIGSIEMLPTKPQNRATLSHAEGTAAKQDIQADE
jgi:hypothetical protein